MSILLYEPDLAKPGGFFSFVYHSLLQVGEASGTEKPRPVPAMRQPREHISAWIEMDGVPVLMDMSDHCFLVDIEALKACGVYLKSNVHRPTLKRVLADADCPELESKVMPFFSFAGYLQKYLSPSPLRSVYNAWKGNSEDMCDVVGVYEHLRRDGETSVYEDEIEVTSSRVHYWARVHTLEAIQEQGLSGTLRLTSRYQTDLEDGDLIHGNLSQPAYRRAIIRSKLLMINTLPHALLPWKATEALALGRPFVVDVPPLMEQAAPFSLQEGDHFISILPPVEFSEEEPGRVLHRFSLDDFQSGAAKVAQVVRDKEQMNHMQQQVRAYRDRAFAPETLVEYLRFCVENAP